MMFDGQVGLNVIRLFGGNYGNGCEKRERLRERLRKLIVFFCFDTIVANITFAFVKDAKTAGNGGRSNRRLSYP